MAANPVLTTAVPAGTTFASFAAPAGWIVTAPPAGGTGAITATASTLAGGTAPDASAYDFVLIVRVEPAAAGGTVLTLNATIAATTPDPNSANNAASASATVTTNPPLNTAPTASDDSYSTVAGQVLVVPARGVLGNDADAEDDPLSASVATPPANGTLALNVDGSFSYTPLPGFSGTDTFTYVASDGRLGSTPATVTIVVAASPVTPPLPSPSDTVGPSVLGIVRFGFHAQPTRLLVRFSEPLNGTSAVNLANYRLISAGRDGRFGTRDDRAIPLRSAAIDATAQTVALVTRRPLPVRHPYQLVVRGSVTDLANNALSGGDQLLPFDRSILAGPSRRVRSAVQVAGAFLDISAGNRLTKFKLGRGGMKGLKA